MKFGEKLKISRKKCGLTQAELAAGIGISARMVIKYENGESYPRDREIYNKIAHMLNIDVNYLLTENEEFVITAANKYGARGKSQAESLIEQATAMFAGGELDDDDKLAFVTEMQRLYLKSKEMSKKYTPNKYKSKQGESK